MAACFQRQVQWQHTPGPACLHASSGASLGRSVLSNYLCKTASSQQVQQTQCSRLDLAPACPVQTGNFWCMAEAITWNTPRGVLQCRQLAANHKVFVICIICARLLMRPDHTNMIVENSRIQPHALAQLAATFSACLSLIYAHIPSTHLHQDADASSGRDKMEHMMFWMIHTRYPYKPQRQRVMAASAAALADVYVLQKAE